MTTTQDDGGPLTVRDLIDICDRAITAFPFDNEAPQRRAIREIRRHACDLLAARKEPSR